MPEVTWLLSKLTNPRSIIDILVVAIIIFWVLWVAQGTRATQLLRGAIILLAFVYLAASTFSLTTLNWLLQRLWPALIIAIPVIFQPEIRRALEQLGHTGFGALELFFHRELPLVVVGDVTCRRALPWL